MKKLLVILLACLSSLAIAQKKGKVFYGSIESLKGQSAINTEYTYDSMIVGVDKLEKEFVEEKKKSWDLKEAGKGNDFEKMWMADRKNRYEPTFDYYIRKTTGLTVNKDNPKYTLIVKTRRSEPGWNAGVVAKGAEIDVEVWLVESANKNQVLGKIILLSQRGKNATGGDFEMGLRLQEAYMEAAQALGALIIKTTK